MLQSRQHHQASGILTVRNGVPDIFGQPEPFKANPNVGKLTF